MSKQKEKLDVFHYHEMTDRLHLILSNIDDFILDHPVIHKHKSIRKQVEKAESILSGCYQQIAEIECKECNK